MKLTYLGTAAAEGFPAVFCNCNYCTEARRLGGKNIRTRSQALINDDLLIDLPADTYSHFLSNGIEGHKIKYLLVTHSHSDHFYPAELEMRHNGFAHNMDTNQLKLFCGKGAFTAFESLKSENWNIGSNLLKPFETVSFGNYTVTALPARHFIGDEPLIYLIESEKTLLYAHDTGYFLDEVFDFLKEKSVKLDFISLDCTCVDIPTKDESSHMGIDNIERVVKKLTDIGVITNNTIKVLNHFSHNANPLHHILEQRVSSRGYIVSYDGLSIEI